jgi:eukaryotic-like serine/threonine-protein kinase
VRGSVVVWRSGDPMNIDQWNRLSDWHNAWLDADVEGRLQLRMQLIGTQPDLLEHADDLLASTVSPESFLETPAFVLAAEQLARDTMTLSSGMEVGPYRVVSLIAHGGMGLVYRATDLRLHRDVALKMLAPIGPPDELRIERFLREARLTAAIDHLNVVKVYDVGVFEGQPYMVVELLEGETLRDRMEREVLTAGLAREIAIGIGKGLIAAHSAGLVHRDLKPENIFLTRSGVTKILDFGIAKLAPDGARTRGAAATIPGLLLGTAGYLSPEQVRGEEVDARADLFAFGSILFETLTGQRAFPGESTVDTLYAILHTPPRDVIGGRDDIPPSLAAIVSRLLEKAPGARFQSAADLTWALEQSGDRQVPIARSRPNGHPNERTAALRWLAIAAMLAVAAFGIQAWRASGSSPADSAAGPPTRFTWTLPDATGLFSAPAVSPDGRRICWAGGADADATQVFVRDLSSLEARPIAGTEGARHVFWSPDGQSIGFFAEGRLKRVSVDGGPAVDLAAAPNARGGTWSRSGVIVFGAHYRDTPLMRVSDDGRGTPAPVTFFDPAHEEILHAWPSFLPDGIHFLYSVVSLRDDRRGVYVGSMDDPPTRSTEPLFPSDSAAVYASVGDDGKGVLLSVGSGRIEYRPFDPARRVVEGNARTMGVDAIGMTPHHPALLDATGQVLAYGSVMVPWGFRFASIGRDGSDLQLRSDRELGGFPRISPDGGRLARTRVESRRQNPDIWVDDLHSGSQTRLTLSADHDLMPVWSPDGREVAYRSGTLYDATIGFAAADGTGVKRTLACPESQCEPNDWSAQGYLIVTVRGRDIWMVPTEPGAAPRPLLSAPHRERDARISPDGRWLAYVSDESGRPEVSVQSLTGPPRRFVVSSKGGDQPVWRADGAHAELLFAGSGGRLQSVSVRSDAQTGLVFSAPATLNVPPLGERHWGTTYDISKDGRRLYFPHAADDRPPREFGVIMNWRTLLKPPVN